MSREGIYGLPSVDKIQNGDQLAIGSANNGDDRRASMTTLTTYLEGQLESTSSFGEYTIQYAAPSATAFNITLTDGKDDNTNIWLILTPTSTFATGTLTLPAIASVVDKQDIIINTTQEVTSLTVDGNGATAVTGAPTTLLANDFFRLKYDAATSTWYTIG